MATWTSYFPSGLSDKLYLDVIVNQSSQSVTNNSSVLSWSAYVAQNAPTASWCHYGDATAKITINGTTVFNGKWNGTGNWDFRGKAAWATQPIASGSITVPHNSDGTKTVTITGTATDTAFPLGTASIGTQSMKLTTIPRASSFTVTPATVPLDGTEKVKVNITRASSSFTHEVYWGSGNFEFSATGVATSATSPIIPKSWAGNLPNHTSSTMYVTVITKSGSTVVGRSTQRIPITVPNTQEFRPTITTSNRRLQSENLPPGNTATVQGYTGWEFVVESAAGAYNSSIASFAISGPDGGINGKWSGSTKTSRTLQVAPLRTSGNQTYKLSVTDTRGRTTTVSVPVTVTPYQPPGVNSATAGRALSNGEPSDTGTFVRVEGLAGFTNFPGNTIRTTAAYRALGKTAWQGETTVSLSAGAVTAVIGSNAIHVDTSWEVRIRATDLLTSSEVILSVPPAKYLQSIDTVNGSVAFGGPATKASEFRVYESMSAHFDGALFHRGRDINSLSSTVEVDGVVYETSGRWPQQTLSNPTVSQPPVYAWTLLQPAPYVPPVGWTFATHLVETDGYTFADTGGYLDGNVRIRVLNISNSGPVITLGWQLVRAYADLTGAPTIPDSPDDIGAAPATHDHDTRYYPISVLDQMLATLASGGTVTLPNFAKDSALHLGVDMGSLESGLYRVTSGAHATNVGLPEAQVGWVMMYMPPPSASTYGMLVFLTAQGKIWVRFKNLSGWGSWTRWRDTLEVERERSIAVGTDWNTITAQGQWVRRYSSTTDVNAPSDAAGVLLVLDPRNPTSMKSQVFVAYNNGGVFTRGQGTSLVWSEWIRLDDGKDLSAGSGPVKDLRMANYQRRRGGVIGTGGLPAVALRFDHWLTAFDAKVLPLLRKHAIPWAQAITTDWVGTAHDNLTWAQLQDGCISSGGEIANHSRTHGSPGWESSIWREIVEAKQILETNLPRLPIEMWMPPGRPDGEYGGYMPCRTIGQHDTYAGRLALAHHAQAFGYMGGHYRPLSGHLPIANTHWTIDTAVLYQLKAKVSALPAGYGLQTMLHPNVLDQAGYMTSATLDEWLGWLAAERDAGRLVILTPSGMTVADADRPRRALTASTVDVVLTGTAGSTRMVTATTTGAGSITVTDQLGATLATASRTTAGILRCLVTVPLDTTAITVALTGATSHEIEHV